MVTAHRINRGLMPELRSDLESDFHFAPCADPEDGVEKVLRLVTERIPARFGLDPVRDVQVFCPMNRGGLGARALNLELQRALNPPGEVRVARFGWTYAAGDKVRQAANDYDKEVYNGDLGFIVRIDPEQGEVVVDFEAREVVYDFGELNELMPAYATTVHRAQSALRPHLYSASTAPRARVEAAAPHERRGEGGDARVRRDDH